MSRRPSSNRSRTSVTAAVVPISRSPSSSSSTSPKTLEREALADELAVARLEDVERQPLARDEHELERKEADLDHP